MRINIGAGKQTWDDFFCIDAVEHPKASRSLDMLYAFEFFSDGSLKHKINLPAQSATEVHSYHFIEHVYAWEAPSVIAEMRRLLKPGGKLVIECPNIEAAAKHLLAGGGDQMCMWPLYGDPGTKSKYMCHRWGYTPKTIVKLLAGFERIKVLPPQTHGKRKNRDMRVEAIKCASI